MREQAFLAFACAVVHPNSAKSYVACLQRVERTLGLDLDTVALEPADVETLKHRLRTAGVPDASARNCGAALRSYGRFRSGDAVALRSSSMPPVVTKARPSSLSHLDTLGLLRLYGDVLDGLSDRGVARTGNGPIGDYAERLFADAFGWSLTDNSAAGHDAEADGVRYQIKACRLIAPNASRQLSALRKLDTRPFDVLAAVLFDRQFKVQRAAFIPFKVVRAREVDGTRQGTSLPPA